MSKVVDPDTLDRFQVCIDPIAETISLRGLGTQRHALDMTGDSDGTTTFTDAGANFTSDGVIAGDILTIISDPANNGGIIGHYRVATVGTTSLTVERSIPASTGADLTYKINAKQTPGGLTPQVCDGVNGQALFSFLKEEWITYGGSGVVGNAQDLNKFDFPIVAITPEQFILGGVNGDAASAWSFYDTNGVQATDTEGATRLLLRDVGWQEKNASDVTLREYANITTLGSLDSDAQAYYDQGDETGTPVDFKLTGPVNQAILTFGPDVGPDAVSTGFAFAATTITRNDGGNWSTDNYRIGDYVRIRSAEDVGNIGTFGPITAVSSSTDGAITIASATFTTNASDTTAVFSVNHKFFTKLFARKKARSYTSAVHDDAGIPTTGLPPQVNKFPLAHAIDPAITLYDGIISGGDGTSDGDIFQDNEVHTSGSDGATSAEATDGTFTFTSAGSTFNSQARSTVILRAGDTLKITSGSSQGTFEIKSVDSATALTCYSEPLTTFIGSESSLTFIVYTGILDTGATNATLANVDGFTGTLTSVGSTFNVDTALGDRIVTTDDIVEVYSGANAVLGYYKVISRTSATVLVLDTSDQPFAGQTSQSYRIWRPGMFMQRFESSATIASATNIAFVNAAAPTLTRTGGSWVTDGFTLGMAITILDAEDSGNIGNFIVKLTPSTTVLTLIDEETVTANATDTVASVNGNITGDSGVVRTINSVSYPFHWRVFANGASLSELFQFIQRELRRTTDIDASSGIARGDITDLLMTFASPNGVTLDMFPDDLSTSELNNVTYTDASDDTRNNAFLVGITFDVNANLISSTNKRLVAYFTSVPSGDFGTNNAVIVDDAFSADMDFTVISADIETTFDYTNNSQGGRTPATDAAITIVALGDSQAQHILTTALITRTNSITIAVGNALERNYSNP